MWRLGCGAQSLGRASSIGRVGLAGPLERPVEPRVVKHSRRLVWDPAAGWHPRYFMRRGQPFDHGSAVAKWPTSWTFSGRGPSSNSRDRRFAREGAQGRFPSFASSMIFLAMISVTGSFRSASAARKVSSKTLVSTLISSGPNTWSCSNPVIGVTKPPLIITILIADAGAGSFSHHPHPRCRR